MNVVTFLIPNSQATPVELLATTRFDNITVLAEPPAMLSISRCNQRCESSSTRVVLGLLLGIIRTITQ